MRLFAEETGLELVEVNLERNLPLKRVFSSLDISAILVEISGITGKSIKKGKTLLFLDEIQAIPEAIAALRYFYEDTPWLPVLSAGSLLEFILSDRSFTMPVGRVEYLHLGPMRFTEFLQETDPFSAKWIDELDLTWKKSSQGSSWIADVPDSMHERLNLRQREYLSTGGMPEAVSVFSETRDFHEVERVHNSIISTYFDDFPKYARKQDLLQMQELFKSLSDHIGKKVVYSRLGQHASSTKIRQILELLIQAGIALRVVHSHGNGIPLAAQMNHRVFKLLFLDAGMLSSMIGTPAHRIHGLRDRELVNGGVLAEQFVGQHLLADERFRSPLFLNYWQRDGKLGNAELDFLVQYDGAVYPVEVKSGASGTLKSLHQFMTEKRQETAVRVDAGTPSVHKVVSGKTAYHLVSLPLYLIEKLPEALSSWQKTGTEQS